MDDQSKPLADDPRFLESLSDLDRGLEPVEPPPLRSPVRPMTPRSGAPAAPDPSPAPEPPAPPRAAPVPLPPLQYPPSSPDEADVPRQGGTRRRPLLDLFPPAPEQIAPAPSPPPPATTAMRPPPATVAPRLASAPPPASPTARASPPVVPARPQATRRPTLADMIAPTEEITYETFYGLNEKPFSLSSDLKFLYHSNAHDRVAQELLSAIRRHDPVVIITGDTGLGKTMLCRAVLEQLDRRTLTSLVTDPFVSIEDLVKTVLVDFGVISQADLASGRMAHAALGDLRSALREFLQSLAPLEAFAVVLIDEAQKLPADALEQVLMLSGSGGEQSLMQVVLVGQPRLLPLLNRSELRMLAQRATVRETLDPLAEDEVAGYVLHRIAVAGANSRVDFDEAVFDRLNELSAGVPLVINLLCDRALMLGYHASASSIDVTTIDRAADDLDIHAPETGAGRMLRLMLNALVLVVLMFVGAAAAAFVFRERVTQTVGQWEALPTPPRPPPLRQPSPLKALPPPPDASDTTPPRPRI